MRIPVQALVWVNIANSRESVFKVDIFDDFTCV